MGPSNETRCLVGVRKGGLSRSTPPPPIEYVELPAGEVRWMQGLRKNFAVVEHQEIGWPDPPAYIVTGNVGS